MQNECSSSERRNADTGARIPIRFIIEGFDQNAEGEFVRYLAPRTVEAILKKLPLEGRAAVWKEEIYFEIPIKMGGEKMKSAVEKGNIAFWPMGSSICVFYGKSQPYSPVSILGRINNNLHIFAEVKSGTTIRVEKV